MGAGVTTGPPEAKYKGSISMNNVSGLGYEKASRTAAALLKRAVESGFWYELPEQLIELRDIMQRQVSRSVRERNEELRAD